MTEFGVGWIMGGGGPQAFTAGADQARRAWRGAGREPPAWPPSPMSASATTLRHTPSATCATITASPATSPSASPPVPSPRRRKSQTRWPASPMRGATN
jgi:hypothetical protein